MDESLQSSLSEEDSSSKEYSLPEEKNESRETPQSEQVEDRSQVESLLCGEEQLTLITESMSITSSDEEKLQLLNKNTELRRLNKELMKLNEEWDHIYHSTSVGLQQRVSALEEESSAVKQLNSRLLLKVEHEQNKREYYEHTLMQELKKNQHLQEYIRLVESRIHQTDVNHWTQKTSDISSTSDVLHRTAKPSVGIRSASGHSVSSQNGVKPRSRLSGIERPSESDAVREVQDLKEQLEALRCQTQIYEADYKTEQKDHERMLQENKRLRRREGEMRQQMALLQEQLKVYEDDFQKERSDKRILQRLLMNKSPAVKDPVLVHRCNNDQDVSRAERRKHREERRAGYVCPKHCEHHRQLDLQ